MRPGVCMVQINKSWMKPGGCMVQMTKSWKGQDVCMVQIKNHEWDQVFAWYR
jgi:hypothetical protein